MTILRNLCILTIIVTLCQAIFTYCEKDEIKTHEDTETELLDKEYGVRYASACEGKFL